MRVTFVLAFANLSGGVRIIAEHARLLHERGHIVRVISIPRPEVRTRDRLRSLLKRRPSKAMRLTSKSHLDGLGLDWHVLESSRPVTNDDVPDADVIVATWWETAEWIASMPPTKGVQVNLLQHYEAHPGQPKDRVDAVWRLPMRKIVVSRWLEGIAREHFGDDSAILVPNGVDTGRFRFAERAGPTGLPVGAMYSPAKFKRFGLAARTVEAVRRRGRAVEFVGFGAGKPNEGALPDGSAFEVAPAQGRIAEIYGSCGCWLFTSDKEGYGLPLLEAMACGTPVVATPAGAAPELLASGGGRLVDSDDPERLADAVEEILGMDEVRWHAMSAAARAEAEKHSWSVIGDRMEIALTQILSGTQ